MSNPEARGTEESKGRMIWLSVFVTVIVGGAGLGFDRVLLREGVSRLDVMLLSNVLTGAVAALLFYKLEEAARERRAIARQRLHTIAEMNHHIRNALQVITYAVATEQRTESLEMIRSSVDRIEWALRSILPEYGSPKPEAAKEQDSTEVRQAT